MGGGARGTHGEKRGAQTILVGKPEVDSALVRHRRTLYIIRTEWGTKNRPPVSLANVGVGLGLCTGN